MTLFLFFSFSMSTHKHVQQRYVDVPDLHSACWAVKSSSVEAAYRLDSDSRRRHGRSRLVANPGGFTSYG